MWAFFVGDFMAIQQIDLKVPGGDTPRSANTKINANFSDQTHAASRIIGNSSGQVPVYTSNGIAGLGLGGMTPTSIAPETVDNPQSLVTGIYRTSGMTDFSLGYSVLLHLRYTSTNCVQVFFKPDRDNIYFRRIAGNTTNQVAEIYTTANTTVVNGSIKPSSPVVKIHTDSLELNDDAEKMGVILNKRGVGDYLLQNTTGLRNDGGWRIELPQDVNGNPYFAVDYKELENNDIEVKTYKRIFDMSTFMFVPDLENPVDIKEGRSIAIRFNDLPQETPTGLGKTNL